MEEAVKVLIIGSGPAMHRRHLYLARQPRSGALRRHRAGRAAHDDDRCREFPGHPDGVTGPDLMDRMRRQAERFGADIRTGTITRVDLASRPFHVVVDGTREIKAETLIIATGASAKYLGLPSETKFRGQGVSACATCDRFFYRKKDVAVVGGGDTACEEASYLASLCRKVYMIVRKPHLRASKAMQQQVFDTPQHRGAVRAQHRRGAGRRIGRHGSPAAQERRHGEEDRHLGILPGHRPPPQYGAFQRTTGARRRRVCQGRAGHVENQRRGVFAAGDVRDPHYRQAITAAASGCIAALDCERFLLK